ncbi:MAG: alpha/beta hydrolase-fold protein [Planctomycetota bacterium]
MRLNTVVAFVMLTLMQAVSAAGQDRDEIVIGKLCRMHSEILDEDRDLEIYLPEYYSESKEAYPVLVVLDGGRFFQYCVSIVNMMSPNYMPGMIIVGLPNTDRTRDLYPLDSRQDEPGTGTQRFLGFMERELIPYIEKEYRALPYRILFGHSLAGLFTLYTLIEKPELFEVYIATSPSIRAPEDRGWLVKRLNTKPEGLLSGKYLYISAGGDETAALHSGVEEFDGFLDTVQGERFEHTFDIFTGEGHVPTKGFYQGLRSAFPHWIPELEFFLTGTLSDIKKHYGELTKKYRFPVAPPPTIISSLGQRMLQADRGSEAVEVYQYYLSVYPRSVFGYLELASAHRKMKDFDKAIEAIEKALKLEPEDKQALMMLKEMRELHPL